MVLYRSNTVQNRCRSEQSIGDLVLPAYIRRQSFPVYMLDVYGCHRELERWCDRCDDTAVNSSCGLLGQDHRRNMH